jgi:hypothetical protein
MNCKEVKIRRQEKIFFIYQKIIIFEADFIQ